MAWEGRDGMKSRVQKGRTAKGAEMSLCLLPTFTHTLLYQGRATAAPRKTKLWLRPRRDGMRNGGGEEKDADTSAALTPSPILCLGLEAQISFTLNNPIKL